MSATFGPFFVPPNDLRVLRGVLAATRRNSLLVSRPTVTADDSGGETTVWNTLPTVVPCRVTNGSGADTEQPDGIRLSAFNDWIIGVATDADVRPSDRLRVTTSDGAVRVIEVTAVRVVRTLDLERLVEGVEIEGGSLIGGA